MTGNQDHDETVARLVELPPGPERDRLLAELRAAGSDTEAVARYKDAVRLIRTADALWQDAYEPPPLEDDPIAAMLGLIPDTGYQLDPRAFKRCRAASGLSPSALAASLTRRGWEVSTRQVFDWENRPAPSVSPALVRAMAERLKVDPDRLTTNQSAASQASVTATVASEAAASPRFQQLVARFAALQGMTERMAASALQSRMLATVHRGAHPSVDQMLTSVEALIDALDQGDASR